MNKANRYIMFTTSIIQTIIFAIIIITITEYVRNGIFMYLSMQYLYADYEFDIWSINRDIIIEKI